MEKIVRDGKRRVRKRGWVRDEKRGKVRERYGRRGEDNGFGEDS